MRAAGTQRTSCFIVQLRVPIPPVPIVESDFRPAAGLGGPHRQTLYPFLFRPRPPLDCAFERIELSDGDFIELAWVRPAPEASSAPLVVVLPGLGGSYESKYARGLLNEVSRRGWRGVLFHFRGTSGIPNRVPRAYHAGAIEDPRFVFRHLGKRFPDAPMVAVGYSLGGNVLLDLLGEAGKDTELSAAAVASVPMMLACCAGRLQRGFSRVYDAYLLRMLKRNLEARRRVVDLPLEDLDPRRFRTVEDFDDAVTAPIHGFSGAQDYYARCSSRPRLKRITVPTLILHAADDPFFTEEVIPTEEELSPAVTLELSPWGGHVGFVEGNAVAPSYWLERRLPDFVESQLRLLLPEQTTEEAAEDVA